MQRLSRNILLATTIACAISTVYGKLFQTPWSSSFKAERFNLLPGAVAQQKSLAVSIREWQDLPAEQFIARLRDFRKAGGGGRSEMNESAYVLARQLEKSLPSGADTASTNSAQEIIELYQEASEVEPLFHRAQNHIIDIATRYGLESDLRTHLEILKARKIDASTRANLDYALAQSYFRSSDFTQAKNLLLALKNEAASSSASGAVTQASIGANYYLGQIDIAEHAAAQPTADQSTASTTNSEGIITEAALKYFRAYIKNCPDGRHAVEIVRRLLAASAAATAAGAGAPPVPASDHDLFAQVFYQNGAFADALKQWDLGSGKAPLEQKAICELRTNHLPEAMKTVRTAAAAGKSYEKAATLISNPLTRAQTLDFWKDILANLPTGARCDDALWNVATRLTPPQGVPYFQRILKQYPTCEYAPEALWWLFWQQTKTNLHVPSKLGPALALAHTGLEKYPTTKAAARLSFWSGKINESLHNNEQAKLDYEFTVKHFPSYYYGHRAKARLALIRAGNIGAPKVDRSFSTKADRQLAQPDWAYPDAETIVSSAEVSKRFGATVSVLYKLSQFDECIAELPADAGPEFKAALYAMKDDNQGAIRAAGKTLEGQPSRHERWQMTYPRVYGGAVVTDSQLEHLDPLLVHALIREESRYNPQALSRTKAMGLMQLMPGTAAGVAKIVGLALSSNADVFKPEVNIRLGTHYLADVLRRADGNAMLAVASYNGGPNAVRQWLSEHKAAGYSDFDVFVENIPYRETRDYVRKVFGSYWTYEEIYPSKS
ncbi:MAG: transglycosylase SLT domain-containing protein [Candidatus Obscuribacterales bacterium]|nr:transglycosylase SLT domain-containing protein [Candidatus Obscuribacterales bacterium]